METRWSWVQPLHSTVASSEIRDMYGVYNRERERPGGHGFNPYIPQWVLVNKRYLYKRERERERESEKVGLHIYVKNQYKGGTKLHIIHLAIHFHSLIRLFIIPWCCGSSIKKGRKQGEEKNTYELLIIQYESSVLENPLFYISFPCSGCSCFIVIVMANDWPPLLPLSQMSSFV